jgi:uncharacterized protein (DUF58 family)
VKTFEHLNHNLYFNTQVFNGFSFMVMISFFCLVAGFWAPKYWAVAGGMIFLLFFLYQKTAAICQGCWIKREVPRLIREKSEIEITYTISNETAFKIDGIKFIDAFDGLEKGFFLVEDLSVIAPHSQKQVSRKVIVNTGMGIKEFGNIKLDFRDELGLFDFKLEILQECSVDVYPMIEETLPLRTAISPDSIEFGMYEIAKRGDSNLFIGTRLYRHGDPVKHINWKLSQKKQELVVNEFEKSTNTFVTFLLDLDLKGQSGVGEVSTWEMAKDLTLSIAHNETKRFNLIQVISNNLYIPFGTGQNQMAFLEKHFTYHELEGEQSSRGLQHLNQLPSGGQLYYLTSAISIEQGKEILEKLKQLKSSGQKVIIFLLNPFGKLATLAEGKMKTLMHELNRSSASNYSRLKGQMGMANIPVMMISSGRESLPEQFKKEARELLEVK